ncbi:MAG TPA: hypothetical protein VGR39_03570, partial [Candidatus Acidoferrales bacterium]|nr:hypothetical protein [Candidatus Acidoferrales bacterium]
RAFILETPIDRPGDDRRNVHLLWRLVGITPKRTGNVADGFPVRRSKRKAAKKRSGTASARRVKPKRRKR